MLPPFVYKLNESLAGIPMLPPVASLCLQVRQLFCRYSQGRQHGRQREAMGCNTGVKSQKSKSQRVDESKVKSKRVKSQRVNGQESKSQRVNKSLLMEFTCWDNLIIGGLC